MGEKRQERYVVVRAWDCGGPGWWGFGVEDHKWSSTVINDGAF